MKVQQIYLQSCITGENIQTTETPLWLLMGLTAVKDGREGVVMFVVSFRDITALKQPIESDTPKGSLVEFQ